MAYTIVFEPLGIRLLCDEPLTIADAARQAGIPLRLECGGKGTCGKCRVQPAPNPDNPTLFERQALGDELARGWRLACRTVVSETTCVDLPTDSQTAAQVTQTEGRALPATPCTSLRAVSVTVRPPSLHDQASDFERLSQAVMAQSGVVLSHASLAALKELPAAVRAQNGAVTAVVAGGELIAAAAGTRERFLGLAVDVGTTKLACYLIDLASGEIAATRGVMNPQIAFGEDIMSRLEAALSQPGAGREQQAAVIQTIHSVAAGLCTLVGEDPRSIAAACMVGNTAMHHLLLGLPTASLAVSPFVPVISQGLDLPAGDLGFDFAPGARIYFPAPIAGFVGSDHLAFLLSEGFGADERVRLGIDIGTNTEIALQAGGRIVSCSTASGPAFEGAHITHGMRAAPGAVERIRIDAKGQAACEVIGGGTAQLGICGSGILDALAELYRNGQINPRGRMQAAAPGIQRGSEGGLYFHLAGGEDSQREIAVTQGDVDQLLLAKGAIRAGLEILMAKLGVQPEDLDEIVLAGAFGTYLDPANAMRIGLLPEIPLAKIHAVGNAAGAGARWMLASQAAREQAARLARQIEYLELTVYPGFSKFFAKGACLPGR
jgi:uncharacterized 2Fe-2S/4Fe-4S cluster protein (DUF4445 family)